MHRDFEIIEHTADIGLRAFGSNMAEAFINAARGMLSLITEPDSIREVLSRDIHITAPDREVLLVEWLNELIFYFDSENLLFNKFEITRLNETELQAKAYGEKVEKTRHILKMGIKSTTYYLLKVEQIEEEYRVQVLFDI